MASGELVSIVLSTADRPTPAEATIGSAVAQAHPEVEIVVVDDGRNTQRVAAPTDPRVRVRRTGGGRGTAEATAMGLDTATGPWALLLEAGAVLAEDAVAELLALARETGGAVVSPVRPRGAPDAERPPPATVAAGGRWILDGGNPVPGPDAWLRCAVLAPTATLRAVGLDPAAGPAWMTDLLVRLHTGCAITVTAPLLTRATGTPAEEALTRSETVLATYRIHRPEAAAAMRAVEDLEAAGEVLGRAGRRADAVRCARLLRQVAPRGAGGGRRALRLLWRAVLGG